MPRPIRLYFDYVDPLAWPAERLALEVERRGLSVERAPLELRPPPAPPLDPADPALVARRGEAAARHAGDVGPEPARVPWTRKAHELGMLAREKGAFPRVHTALLTAHLSRALDIGRVDVLVQIATEEGLDPTESKAVLDVDRHAEAVERIREHAFELGVRAVPTFVVGTRIFEGLPDPDALARAATEE